MTDQYVFNPDIHDEWKPPAHRCENCAHHEHDVVPIVHFDVDGQRGRQHYRHALLLQPRRQALRHGRQQPLRLLGGGAMSYDIRLCDPVTTRRCKPTCLTTCVAAPTPWAALPASG